MVIRMRKLIIDCDPGHDDAMALAVAFSHQDKLDIQAVGTVGGNHYLSKITNNARLTLQALKANVPLYQGCEKPLVQELPVQPGAHGESGMDGLSKTEPLTYPIEEIHAVNAYYSILKREKEVTIVGLGPLTNIATLLKMYPDAKNYISEIAIMGGGIDRGNVTAYAEFNIFADPEAANIVFESGIPIIMSGLDVTEKATLTFEDIQTLNNQSDKTAFFFYELLMFYYESGKQFGFTEAAIHDAAPIVQLIKPELFKGKHQHVAISCDGITRGMTCADKRVRPSNKANTLVLYDVDQIAFAKCLLESVKSYNKEV